MLYLAGKPTRGYAPCDGEKGKDSQQDAGGDHELVHKVVLLFGLGSRPAAGVGFGMGLLDRPGDLWHTGYGQGPGREGDGMADTKLMTASGKVHRVQRIRRGKEEVPFSSEANGKYWTWCGRTLKGKLVSDEIPTTCDNCKRVE